MIPSAISTELGQVTVICGLLFAFFYILFADGFRDGQCYGKRIMKTAVIDATTGVLRWTPSSRQKRATIKIDGYTYEPKYTAAGV
jgi:uncharacterized RDD family membrane protein YckC